MKISCIVKRTTNLAGRHRIEDTIMGAQRGKFPTRCSQNRRSSCEPRKSDTLRWGTGQTETQKPQKYAGAP